MPSDHMDTAQPSELACLPQEHQSHNEAQDLLLLQDYVCKLSHTQRTLEDTLCLIAANRTPCRRYQRARLQSHTHGLLLLKSLRIRVEVRANVTERAVIGRQLQLMQASVQHYLQRTSTQLTQVARPGPRLNTSITDLVPVQRMNARIPCTNVAEPATMVNRPHRIQLTATHEFVDR